MSFKIFNSRQLIFNDRAECQNSTNQHVKSQITPQNFEYPIHRSCKKYATNQTQDVFIWKHFLQRFQYKSGKNPAREIFNLCSSKFSWERLPNVEANQLNICNVNNVQCFRWVEKLLNFCASTSLVHLYTVSCCIKVDNTSWTYSSNFYKISRHALFM